MTTPLVLPRRLAIAILHAAQIAAPEPTRGWVMARSRTPLGYREDPPPADGHEVFARCFSKPGSAAVPEAGELTGEGLHLVISLNTKGVLEMRGWRRVGEGVVEQTLSISD